MDCVVVPHQQRLGLTEASEGPPPPRALAPHVGHPNVVEHPLRVPRFRVHGVHDTSRAWGALRVLVGRDLSFDAVERCLWLCWVLWSLSFHSWLSPGIMVSPLVAAVVTDDSGAADETLGSLPGELAVAA